MKSDVGSLALLDIILSHGEEMVFEMHLRLGPWMVYFFVVFGSLGLRDLPFMLEDQDYSYLTWWNWLYLTRSFSHKEREENKEEIIENTLTKEPRGVLQ